MGFGKELSLCSRKSGARPARRTVALQGDDVFATRWEEVAAFKVPTATARANVRSTRKTCSQPAEVFMVRV